LGLIINCECTKCNCDQKFQIITTEELLNLIQHGRLNQKQSLFLKSRIGSKLCKPCFVNNHMS